MKPTLKTILIGMALSCLFGVAGANRLSAQSDGFGSNEFEEPGNLEGGSGKTTNGYSSAADEFANVQVTVQQVPNKRKKTGSGGFGGAPDGSVLGGGLGGAPGGVRQQKQKGPKGIGGSGGSGAGAPGGLGMGLPGSGAGAPGGLGMGLEDEDAYAGADGGMGMDGYGAQHVTLVLKMYQIGDLLSRSADGSFSGFVLPGIDNLNPLPPRSNWGGGAGGGGFGGGPGGISGGGGFGGGAGGGGMGVGGGGRRYIPSNSSEVTIRDLMGTIESTVARSTWEDVGGVGAISHLGDILIVNQSKEVHQQIDTFLQMLRGNQTRKPTVTLKAIWLSINEEQFQSLDIEDDQQVNSRVLAELVKSHGQRGQVTCFDGQTTHLAAGNLKSTIESVVPVVGQIEFSPDAQPISMGRVAHQSSMGPRPVAPARLGKNAPIPGAKRKPIPRHVLAQGLGTGNIGGRQTQNDAYALGKSVGYQPVSRWINYGAVLQLTPKVDADQKMLTLEVGSVLVSGGNENQLVPTKVLKDYDLDQHNLRCQQFRSNVRLKASTPTLIGGSAFQSAVGEEQTYLIIEAIVNND